MHSIVSFFNRKWSTTWIPWVIFIVKLIFIAWLCAFVKGERKKISKRTFHNETLLLHERVTGWGIPSPNFINMTCSLSKSWKFGKIVKINPDKAILRFWSQNLITCNWKAFSFFFVSYFFVFLLHTLQRYLKGFILL